MQTRSSLELSWSKQCPVIIRSHAVHILKHAVDAFAMRTRQTAYWRLTFQLLLKAFVLQSRCCIVCSNILFCSIYKIKEGQMTSSVTRSTTCLGKNWTSSSKTGNPVSFLMVKALICLKVWRDYCNVTDDLKCPVINNFLFTFWIAVDSIQLWGHFTSIIFL